jgi:uncharacterized protein involved in response to NO
MSGPPWTILNYAFRPFFLANGLFAMLAMSVWIMALHGVDLVALPPNTTFWHGHEMLVGFAGASIAGFLLTAVATWTGRPPVQGAILGWLVIAWLAGRLAMALAGNLPAMIVAAIDLCFPVLLCIIVSAEIIGARNRRNLPIAIVTGIFALLNLVYHLGVSQVLAGADRVALYLLIHLVLMLITIVGGRIIPNFTANWLKSRGDQRVPATGGLIDVLAIVFTIVVGVAANIPAADSIVGILALAAALAHALRLSRWCGLATTGEPLLFVLHVAYFWLPVGYTLMGLAEFGIVFTPTAALHALTMGGVGGMVLAVTTRVALAHTGRTLHAARLTVLAYWIFMLAVLLRTLSTLSDTGYMRMIDLAAFGWILAFGLFSWVYWPVLTQPRADGKPERTVSAAPTEPE